MNAMRNWWSGLSERERRLIAIMLQVIAVFVVWLGIWRPVNAAIVDGWRSYGAAIDRNAAVRARVEQIRGLPTGGGAASAVPLGQLIPQSAVEAGLTIDRGEEQGGGRFAVTINAARAGAVLGWLSALEQRGIAIETLTMTPAATGGTVTAQIVLRSAA